jgi:hypothetical protein
MTNRFKALWEIGVEMDRLRAAGEWNEQHFRELVMEAHAMGEGGDDIEFLSMYSKRDWRQRLREDLKRQSQPA